MGNSSHSHDEMSRKNERGGRLRYLREEILRLSRAEMKKLGFSNSTIENWEYGRYGGLTEKGAKQIQEACQKLNINCTEHWLLYGIGRKPTSPLVQQLNKSIGHSSADETEIIAEELNTFHELNNGTIDAIIQDDGMLPCLLPGDYVAGIQHFGNDIEKIIDNPCIVTLNDGSILVRLLKKGNLPNHFSLLCANTNSKAAQPKSDVKLTSAAPIIWIRRRSKA